MNEMLDMVLQREDLASLDVASRRLALREILHANDAICALPAIADHIDGFGPIGPLMRDPSVTDVLINGHDEVWVEREGELQATGVAFGEPNDLRDFIERMLGRAGRRADASHPIDDARLPDGSRIHVVMPPLSGVEPVVSIRLFPREPRTLDDLVAAGGVTDEQASLLSRCIRERRSILLAGPTGAGKTTLLNALLATIPSQERIVTIEETAELRRMGHHVALVSRPAGIEGRGLVTLDQLLRAALRMRPDRIVVGEVRGPEAAVAVDAMSTGHEGSLLTIHASSAAGALERLARLATGDARGSHAAVARVGRAIQLVVFLRKEGRVRRIGEVLTT